MAATLLARKSTNRFAEFCGGAHLTNFGICASPERDLGYDVNDFDETLAGPFDWAVLRLRRRS